MPTGTGGRVRALRSLMFWRYAHYRAREMAPCGCEICCAERNETNKYQFSRKLTNQGKWVVRGCWIWYDILTEKAMVKKRILLKVVSFVVMLTMTVPLDGA